MRCACAAALTAGLVLGASETAHAQDASDLARAREAFKHALADEQAGQYEKAAGEFTEARTLAQKETPQVLFHLGVCHARLGRLVAARGELSSAVERAKAEGLDKVATTAKTELDAVLPRIATITVKKPDHGAVTTMTLDRVDASAKVGVAIDVDPGPHDVHAELSDGPPADVHLTVAAGEHKDVTLAGATSAVAPSPAPVPPAPVAPAPAPGPDTSPVSTPAPSDAATPSSGTTTLGWIVGGTGVALVAGGAVFWVLRGNEVSTLSGECGPTQHACPQSASSDISNGKTYDAVGMTLFIAGGAAVLGGAGLLLFGGHSSTSTAVQVTPFVTGHSAGLGVTGVTW
jgi:hypothetical protein